MADRQLTELQEKDPTEAGDLVYVRDGTTGEPKRVEVQKLMPPGGLEDAYLQSTVAFRGTTSQSIPNSTETAVTTYTETFDIGGDFDHTTGIFTAPYTGIYHFDASTGLVDVANRVMVYIKDGGTYYAESFATGTAANHDPTASVGVTLQLTAGDGISMSCYHQAGSSKTLKTTSQFSGHMVARTA